MISWLNSKILVAMQVEKSRLQWIETDRESRAIPMLEKNTGSNKNVEWNKLATAANEYCELIEHVDRVGGDWLETLSCILSNIHTAVLVMGQQSEPAGSSVQQSNVDYEQRFELYSQLRRLLGERDKYWLEFDTDVEDENGMVDMSGSLADDITDIYFELKSGLELLEKDPGHPARAATQWQSGFMLHWGQHLVDAERHLYELNVYRQLSSQNHVKHAV